MENKAKELELLEKQADKQSYSKGMNRLTTRMAIVIILIIVFIVFHKTIINYTIFLLAKAWIPFLVGLALSLFVHDRY